MNWVPLGRSLNRAGLDSLTCKKELLPPQGLAHVSRSRIVSVKLRHRTGAWTASGAPSACCDPCSLKVLFVKWKTRRGLPKPQHSLLPCAFLLPRIFAAGLPASPPKLVPAPLPRVTLPPAHPSCLPLDRHHRDSDLSSPKKLTRPSSLSICS